MDTSRKAIDAPDEPDEVAARRGYYAFRLYLGRDDFRDWDAMPRHEQESWIAATISIRTPVIQSRDLWKNAARRLNAESRREDRYGAETPPRPSSTRCPNCHRNCGTERARALHMITCKAPRVKT